MSGKLNNPHDAFMKSLLGDISVAREFLLQFLPLSLREQLDFSRLTAGKSSFVTQELKEVFSDAVFEVGMKEDGGKSCFVSILLEHKSYADERAPFQILLYLAQGYLEQWKKRELLRPVVPLLFYHGAENWELRPVEAYFDGAYVGMLQYVPRFEAIFASLAYMSEADIGKVTNAWLRAALLTQKYSHSPDELVARLLRIFQTIYEATDGNFFQPLTVYLFELIHISEEQMEQIIKPLPPADQEKIMSLYDRILQKGMEKGMEKGIEKEKIATILRGYKEGFSPKVLCVLTGLTENEVKAIIAKAAKKKN